MRAGLGVDELGVHPHLIAAVLFAALQDVAHAEVFADLLHVHGLALVGEGGAARDHERAADPREARGQPLGEDIGEVILRRIAAQIGKGEYNNGKSRRCCRHLGTSRWPHGEPDARRDHDECDDPRAQQHEHRTLLWCGGLGRLRLRRLADFERIDPDRLGDVLELGWAEIGDREIEPSAHLAIGVLGKTDRAGLGDAFQSRGDIDAVAHQIAVALLDHIAEMDADAELDTPLGRQPGVALDHAVLHLDGAAHGVDHAAKLDERAVAGALDDAAVMRGDGGIDQIARAAPAAAPACDPRPRRQAGCIRRRPPPVSPRVSGSRPWRASRHNSDYHKDPFRTGQNRNSEPPRMSPCGALNDGTHFGG